MPNLQCHSYFDEAGDPGSGSSSSDHLVIGGFTNSVADEAAILHTIDMAKQEFGLPATAALQFKKLSHEKRLRWSEIVAGMPITIFVVVQCKRGHAGSSIPADSLYNWLVRLGVERCSWWCRESGRRTSVTLEHPKGYKIKKMKDYMDKLQNIQTQLSWPNLHLPIRFGSKATVPMLQVADCVASSAGHAFQPQFGYTTDTYLRHLSPRLWRRYGQLMSYGLKLQPPLRKSKCSTDHSWVSTL